MSIRKGHIVLDGWFRTFHEHGFFITHNPTLAYLHIPQLSFSDSDGYHS